jgi:hypothetical protein
VRADEFGLAAQHIDLALLGEHGEPVGQLGHDSILPGTQEFAIDRRRREHDAAEDISAASSITLAACRSAFDGMQPTLRHTPPSIGQRSMRVTLSPKSAARKAAV